MDESQRAHLAEMEAALVSQLYPRKKDSFPFLSSLLLLFVQRFSPTLQEVLENDKLAAQEQLDRVDSQLREARVDMVQRQRREEELQRNLRQAQSKLSQVRKAFSDIIREINDVFLRFTSSIL
jgi:uncharacterized protein YlxW (UPF0749 family)